MVNKYSTSKQTIILVVMGFAVGLVLVLKGIIGDISFTRYNDEMGLFSLDYPSAFHVASRTIENSTLSVDFRSIGSSEFLSVMIYPKESDMYFKKSNLKLQETVGDPNIELEKYYFAICNPDGNRYLLFRPTEETGHPYKIYIYYEEENNFIVQVMYFAEGDPKYGHSVLEHIFSSLTWSSVETANALSIK